MVERLGLPSSYLLHVGTIEPRKNLLMLMRAYCDLPGELRARCPLVLVGGWGWNTAEIAEYHDTVARHRNVRHLGYVSDADLPALYTACPRFGFSVTLRRLRLAAFGNVGLRRRRAVFDGGSACGDFGRPGAAIDALDLAGWREALRQVIVDDDWVAILRRNAAEVARPYTWQRLRRETYEVYERVLGKNLGAAKAA